MNYEQGHLQEWCQVQNGAISHLRECRHILGSKHLSRAQLLVLPSFDDVVAVDIVETKGELAAHRTYWRQSKDGAAFATPLERLKHPIPFLPSYESVQLDVDFEQLNVALSKLERAAITVPPQEKRVFIDGTSYELRIGTGYVTTRLKWHTELPGGWSNLRDGLQKLMHWTQAD